MTALENLTVFSAIAAFLVAAIWMVLFSFRFLAKTSERRKLERIRHGGCGNCGYAIFPAQNRCPECGQSVNEVLR